jgi:fructosamine-3-kinase
MVALDAEPGVVKKWYSARDTSRFKVLGSGARNEHCTPAELRDLVPSILASTALPWGEQVDLERRAGHCVAEPDLTNEQARQAGRALGRIHRQRGEHRGALDGSLRYTSQRDAFGARWRHAVTLLADLDADLAHRLDEWAAQIVAELPERPCRLVHGDFGLANLLFEGDEVATVLDWEHARWGDPAEDWAKIDLAARFAEPNGFGTRADRLEELRRGSLETCEEPCFAPAPVRLLYEAYYAAVLDAFFAGGHRHDWLRSILDQETAACS